MVGKELAEIDGNNGRAFSEEFRIAVYRIVEEALSNVVKHSRATEATIELHYSKKGGFTLGIGDNGCGLAVSKVSFGLGLIAMRDYAEALGGGFNLESSPGRGTKIQVMLPPRHQLLLRHHLLSARTIPASSPPMPGGARIYQVVPYILRQPLGCHGG